ncbi:regulator of chromosome condensation 1/beta-lactamase-inhibitor protein II, partial [Syncephalis pseudoplumigaleata]
MLRSTEDKEAGRRGRKARKTRAESDIHNRNPAHYAASWGCTGVLRAVRRTAQRSLELNAKTASKKDRAHVAGSVASLFLAGINGRDEESGWTPLHRALYYGRIRSAIELLQLDEIDPTLKVRPMCRHHALHGEGASASTCPPRTTLYTWGSNANYLLGHADQGDRLRPDRVSLPFAWMGDASASSSAHDRKQQHLCPNAQPIVMAAMSKLHMLVVMAPTGTGNLLTCGFGHGGRLGNSESTRFTLEPVHGLPHAVQTAACGRDHTVAITVKGEVYTFGGNRWGQLGYAIVPEEAGRSGVAHERDKENPVQLEPKRVLGALRSQRVIGCSASTWHTAVYTRDALYTFGRDMGQLGYETTSECQVQPRCVSQLPPQQTIVQVAATEMATTCLMASGEVYALAQGRCQRITLPSHRIPQGMSAYQPSSVREPGVVRLASDTEGHAGALTAWGDIFLWSTDPGAVSAGKRVRSIRRIWSSR